ncbi:MAG: cytochrome c3 family protein [Gordonibacter pamelaeae]
MSIDEEKRAAGGAEPCGPGNGHKLGRSCRPSDGRGQEPASKKRPKRGWIVAGVVAAVIVVAGAGFWVWHEQPSFCNAICHSPMDYYVETYDSGDPQLGVTVHAKAGESCLRLPHRRADDPNLGGDGLGVRQLPHDRGRHHARHGQATRQRGVLRAPRVPRRQVLDEITAGLWGFAGNDEKYNPHANHEDAALECGDCHKAHENQVLVCNECHDLTLPEGWEAPNVQ